jgi:hypothetical protein
MSAARQLISEAALHGATFRFDGDRVRLIPQPGEPIPTDLIERAKAMRPALIAELRGRAQIGSKARRDLRSYPCPEGFSPERWERLREGAARFATEWADQAMRLGWTFDELFAFSEPFANVSLQGAAWFVGGSTVTAVIADAITLRRTSGATTRIYRESARERKEPEAGERRL